MHWILCCTYTCQIGNWDCVPLSDVKSWSDPLCFNSVEKWFLDMEIKAYACRKFHPYMLIRINFSKTYGFIIAKASDIRVKFVSAFGTED